MNFQQSTVNGMIGCTGNALIRVELEPEQIQGRSRWKKQMVELALDNLLKLKNATRTHVLVRKYTIVNLYLYLPYYKCHLTLPIFIVVDCVWSNWTIGECDKTCGGGFRTNSRAPTPEAQHGGEECTGHPTVTESCNIQECPGIFYVNFLNDRILML